MRNKETPSYIWHWILIIAGASVILVARYYVQKANRVEPVQAEFAQHCNDTRFVTILYPRIGMQSTADSMSASLFLEHMTMLKDAGYSTVGLQQVRALYYEDKLLPEKAVAILLDGSRDTYINAAPVIQELGLRATVMLNVRAMRHKNRSFMNWHNLKKMQRYSHWDFGVTVDGDGGSQEQLEYLQDRFADIRVCGISVPADRADSVVLSREELLFLPLRNGDGYNSITTDPSCLNLLKVKAQQHHHDLARLLSEICSRRAGSETAAAHMERGHGFYQSGDYESSLEEFQAATQLDPGYVKGWEDIGWAYWKMGKIDRTLEVWKNLKAIHPDRPMLLNMIAQAHTAKKEYEQALASYQDSLEIEPDQKEVLAVRCEILYWARRHSDAVTHCLQFLSSYPESSRIRQLLAELQISPEIADYQGAIDNWQQLVEERPNEPDLQVALAKAYYNNESYQQAFETARRISELDSEHVPALEILLDSAIRMQQYESAQDAVAKLRAVDPDYPEIAARQAEIHNTIGLQFYQDGDYQSALEKFQAAIQVDPGYLCKGRENIGWAYWKMGKIDRTLEAWKSLKAIHPDRPMLLNMIAQAHTAREEYEQALASYQESLETKPGQMDVLAVRCEILYWAGRHSDAVTHCLQFLSSYPESSRIRQLLAELQMSPEIADYQGAIDNWQQLIEDRPNEPELQVALAKAYYNNESYQQAFETARDVSDLNSENSGALEIVLASAIRMEQYELAQDTVAKLQNIDPDYPEIAARQAEIHDAIALQLYQDGDYQSALEEFQAAAQVDPEYLKAREDMGWTYRRLGRNDQAISIWEELLDDRPNDTRILNAVARAQADKRMFDRAVLTYDRSLKIDPAQTDVRLARATVNRWIGNYHDSADELFQLVAEHAENAPMRYQLALCLLRLQRYEEATRHFQEVITAKPDDPQCKMGMARALYFRQRYPEALGLVDEILARDPANLEALDFLADDATYTGDFQRSSRLLNAALAVDGSSVPRLNRLADCAERSRDFKVAIRATEKSLALHADQPVVRLLYADSLRLAGNLAEAERQYQGVLKDNRNNINALMGLKECCVSRKDYREALLYLRRALSIDSTNVYLMRDEAKLLAYAGEYSQSVKLLEDLLERVTARQSVLALLYHGLTKDERSNILRLRNFRAQMEVLSELGYSAVTTEDMARAWEGKGTLPGKTVLITFDDARRDSFEYADSVLQDLSFKATMFVSVRIVEAKDPHYSDWQQIEHYAGTDHWDIQSHGDYAHYDIPVDAAGTRRRFLTNRRWLDDKSRLENDREYRERIDSDYRKSIEILESRSGAKINAFAFPFGDLGQMDSAYVDSVAHNLTSVRKHFALSVVQSEYGFNLVGDNPHLLKRLEVPETWTAQELRDHVAKNDPIRLVKLNLAEVCHWAGKNSQAIRLYDELLRDNPLDKEVLLGKAMACKSNDRFFEARTILDQVLEQDSTNQVALAERERIDKLATPVIDNFLSSFEDEDKRQRLKWGTSLRLPVTDELTLEPSWARAELDDKNVSRVLENEYSLSTMYRLGEAKYDLSYTFRDFFGADDAHNYSLAAGMPLLFDNVTFNHAYRSEEAAGAAIQGIRYHENAISIYQPIDERISTYFRYRRSDFTDDNWRNSVRLNGLYRFFDEPKLYAGCELAADDTDFYSPLYYTPDQLRMVQAVFMAEGQVSDDLKYSLWYAVGYAREHGNVDEIVQNASASMDLRVSDSWDLGLALAFSDSPNYGSEYVLVNLQYRF